MIAHGHGEGTTDRCRRADRLAQTGLLHDRVTGGSRSLSGWRGHDCFVFDGGQSSEGGLPAASVVGPLDPGHEGAPCYQQGVPSLAVEPLRTLVPHG